MILIQQTIKYDEPFFKPPVVLATVYNAAKGNKSNDGCDNKDKEPLLTWMEVGFESLIYLLIITDVNEIPTECKSYG